MQQVHQRMRLSLTTVCAALLLSTASHAQTPASPPLTAEQLASPGAVALRSLSRDVINAPKPKRFSLAAKRDQEEADARLTDEITVIGAREPEDIVSKKPPMLAFRDQMDREKPMTPKQIAQVGLCLIGLCGANYGPEGAPVESKAFTRSELGSKKSSLDQSLQFRGTLQ